MQLFILCEAIELGENLKEYLQTKLKEEGKICVQILDEHFRKQPESIYIVLVEDIKKLDFVKDIDPETILIVGPLPISHNFNYLRVPACLGDIWAFVQKLTKN